ncbi:MAG: outer membrane beta-barrel protein [Bacteroidaceae bacterium]|nr:outer membrane beta-barrel protein [Bacteroidaceae bacterium]MBQ9170075.1 outer membrane beta-barrel protein [Bacteroidaceae bacterium]MBQ9294856.1 outer membrane beta-barrel protein [Bacteroidaceae bacterium]
MNLPTICRYTCFLLLISLACTSMQAQEPQQKKKEKAPLLSGVTVSADIVGFAMKAVGAKFANMEVGARINFRDKYFPAAELGIGDCHKDGAETGNSFSTTSPYMRFGMDYNFNKKHNGNRLFGLFRYGFSSFKYDISNDTFTDPTYGTSVPLRLDGEKATAQWLEFGAGVETKLWRFIRLGWSIRYKFRVSIKTPDEGKPYFIPGFGKNDSNGWGGTMNLVFDIGKGSFKSSKEKKNGKS